MRLHDEAPRDSGDDPGANRTQDDALTLATARAEWLSLRERIEAAAWKADRRRFTGEGPTGFGTL